MLYFRQYVKSCVKKVPSAKAYAYRSANGCCFHCGYSDTSYRQGDRILAAADRSVSCICIWGTRAPMRTLFPRWGNPTPLKQAWLKHLLTWRGNPKGTRAWSERTVREAPSPKRLCKLGRIGSALDWANVRRLVAGKQPEGHGAIASA